MTDKKTNRPSLTFIKRVLLTLCAFAFIPSLLFAYSETTPTTLDAAGNLQYWVDGSDVDADGVVDTSNAELETWVNKANSGESFGGSSTYGNGTSGGTTGPYQNINMQNGLPTIFFDESGNGDYHEPPNHLNIAGDDARAILFVLDHDAPGMFFSLDPENSTSYKAYRVHEGKLDVKNKERAYTTSLSTTAGYQIFLIQHESAAKLGNMKVFIDDGGTHVGSSGDTGTLNTANGPDVMMGRKKADSHEWEGSMAEVFVFDASLSAADRATLFHHLATKWGLKTTVDSDGDGTFDIDDFAPTDDTKTAVGTIEAREDYTYSDLTITIEGTANNTFSKLDFSSNSNTITISTNSSLTVTLNGYTPVVDDSWDIMDFGTLSGTFSSMVLPTLSSTLVWNTANIYTTGVISVDEVPTATAIADQVTTENSAVDFSFNVSDNETSGSSLTVLLESSDTTLLPQANISTSNTNGTISVTLTPVSGRFDNDGITVTAYVSDALSTTSQTFTFTVNDSPTIDSTVDVAYDISTTGVSVGITGASDAGTLDVNNTLTLGGTLTVDKYGYEPALGETFNLLDWNSLSGTFEDINLPTLNAGLAWDIDNLYIDGTITVIAVPAEISTSPILWLDATDTGSIISENQLITTWINKMGVEDLDMAQSDTNKQPTLNVGALNGLDIIRFDDTNLSADTFLPTINGFEVFIVVANVKTSSQWEGFIGQLYNTSPDRSGWYIGKQNQDKYAYFYATTDSNTSNKTSTSTDRANSILSLSQGLSAMTFYENGGIVGTDTSPVRDMGGYNLTVGAALSTAYITQASIAEVIAFDTTLSDTDRTVINYALSVKWGLESVMDSDNDGVFDADDEYPTDNTKIYVIGDTTSAGDVTIGASDTLQFDLTSASNYESVTINGTFTAGGTLEVVDGGYSPAYGDQFNLINDASSYSGSWATITLPTLSGDYRWNTSNLQSDGYIRVNSFPTISTITDKSTDEDVTLNIQFTIDDIETSSANLLTTILLDESLATIATSNTDGTLTVTFDPVLNQHGNTTATVNVFDGLNTTTVTFDLTVNPVNDLTIISSTQDETITLSTGGSTTFTVSDVDGGVITLTFESTNPSLIPSGHITSEIDGTQATVTFDPINNTYGSATITINAIEDSVTVSTTIIVTVDGDTDLTGTTYNAIISGTNTITSLNAEALTLAATLNITKTVTPGVGETFDLFDWTSLTGRFTDILLPTLNAGLSWDLSNLYVDGTITVIESPGSGVSNLVFWLDVSDDGTVVTENTNPFDVFRVIDKSGNQNNAHPLTKTTALAPSYTPNGQNGLPVLDFDGTEEELRIESLLGATTSGRSLFVVTKLDSADNGRVFIYNGNKNGTSHIYLSAASKFDFGTSSQTLVDPYSTTDYSILSLRYNDNEAPEDVEYFINGVSTPNTISDATAINLDGDHTAIGGQTNNTTKQLNGQIAEILSYDKEVSDAERAEINYYLSQKWGLTALIDSDNDTVTDNVDTTPTENNSPPILAAISNKTTSEDIDITENISVTNTENDTLVISLYSSNPSLLPTANISITNNANTLEVTYNFVQDMSGSVTVTINVDDGEYGSTQSFTITVESVNDAPILGVIPSLTTSEDTSVEVTFNVTDVDNSDGDMSFTFLSSDTAIIQTSTITTQNTNTNEFGVTFNPELNANGTVTITINVYDGVTTDTQAITITVDAVDDATAISATQDVTIPLTTGGATTFNVVDVDGAITLTFESSNTGMIPVNAITSEINGTQARVTFDPVDNVYGSAIITINAKEAGATDSTTIVVTVDGDTDLTGTTYNAVISAANTITYLNAEALTFGGTLNVTNTYDPALGETFNLFDWTSTTNAFTNIILPTLNAGLGWDLSSLYLDGTLSVEAIPGDISATPILWLDASDRGTIFTESGTITRWLNKAGYAEFDAYQTDSARQPVVSDNALNGLDTILFAEDGFSTDGHVTQTNGLEVFVVVSDPKSTGTTTGLIGEWAGGSSKDERSWYMGVHNTDQYSSFYALTDSSSGSKKVDLLLEDVILNTYIAGTGDDQVLTFRANGSLVNTVPETSGTGFYDGGTNLTIGTNRYDTFNTFAELAEVLIFESALTTQNRIDINYDLAVKWGLTALTDSDDDTVTDNVDTTPTENNSPPILAAISDITTSEDINITRSVALTNTESDTLTITVLSSDTGLLPVGNIDTSDEGSSLDVTFNFVADMYGEVSVTISVDDGEYTSTQSFSITVEAVNDAPVLGAIPDLTTNEDNSVEVTFNVTDVDNSDGDMSFTFLSSDTAVIQTSTITTQNTNTNEFGVTFNPELNAFGTITVTINVYDGVTTDTQAIIITVNAVDDATVISATQDVTINLTTGGATTFNVVDVDGAITLTFESSNTGMIPVNAITSEINGTEARVTFDPVDNVYGTATITINAKEAGATASTTILVTVDGDTDLTGTTYNAVISGTNTITYVNAETLTLEATLNITKTVEPTEGETFDLFDWTSINGTFTYILLPTLNAGLAWDLSTLYTNGEISVEKVIGNNGISPIMWLDADEAGSLSLDTGVRGWTNKMGVSSFNVFQADGTKQPIINTAELNSKNTIRFDEQTLVSNANVDTTGGIEVFIVVTNVTGENWEGYIGQWGSTDPEKEWYIGQASDQKSRVQMKNTSYTSLNIPASTAITTNLILNMSSETDSTTFYENGDTIGSNAHTINSDGSEPLVVGGYRDTIFNTNVDIAEVLVFDTTLNAQERYNINYALSSKWGLTAYVDSDGDTVTDNVDTTPTENNSPPILAAVNNITTSEDITVTRSITLTNTESDTLTITVLSSDSGLLPVVNIDTSDEGSSLDVTFNFVTDMYSDVSVTISVDDGEYTSTQSFSITVEAVNDAPVLGTISDLSTNEDNSVEVTFNVTDVDNSDGDMSFTFQSSDTAIIQTSTITTQNTNTNEFGVTFNPELNAFGTVTVTINVYDGVTTDTQAIIITVNAVDDATVISATQDVTINLTTGGVTTFNVVDVDGAITLTFESSNTGMIPVNAITSEINGTEARVTFDPVDNVYGTATITINAKEAGATASTTILVTVDGDTDLTGTTYNAVISAANTITYVNAEALTLSVTLNITKTVEPSEGESFDLFDWTSLTNRFTDILLPTLNTGLAWDLSNLYIDGTIDVIESPGSGVSNLVFWFDASDDGTIVTENASPTEVYRVIDKSGNTNNAYSPSKTSALAPTYVANGQNSLPVLDFDGTENELRIDSLLGDATAGRSIFIVTHADVAGNGRLMVINGDLSGSSHLYISSGLKHDFGTSSFSLDPDVSTTTYSLVGLYYASGEAPRDVNPYLDGSLESFSNADSTAINFDGDHTMIGGQSNNTTKQLNGQIAEILTYDKEVTDAERAEINYYLSQKWGLTASVDSDDDTVTDNVDTTPTENNSPPILAAISDITTSEDITVTRSIALTNTESDTLTITVLSSESGLLPVGNVDTSDEGAFLDVTFNFVTNIFGEVSVTISVDDGEYTSTQSFSITVNAVNDAPVLGVVPNAITSEDTSVSVTFNVSDIETASSDLTVSFETSNDTIIALSGISSQNTTGIFTVTFDPVLNANGEVGITINVSDSELTDSQYITITVNAVNDAPAPIAVPDATTNEDTPVTITFNVTDVDNSTANLTASFETSNDTIIALSGISSQNISGQFRVTIDPVADANGTVTITVNISDGALSGSQAITVTVNPVNDAPILGTVPNLTTSEDIDVDVTFNVTDIDNTDSELTFTFESSDTSIIPTTTITTQDIGVGEFRVTFDPVYESNGEVTVTINVSDGEYIDSQAITITVNGVTDPTVLSATQNVTINLTTGGTTTFNVYDGDGGAITITFESANEGLIPVSGITSNIVGTEVRVTFDPVDNVYGATTITINAKEAGSTASTTIRVDVDGDTDLTTSTHNAVITAQDTITYVNAEALTLGATLNITKSGYEPTFGETFNLFDWTSITGIFSHIELPTLNAGLAWNLNNFYIDGTITVENVPGDIGVSPKIWLDANDFGSVISSNSKVMTWLNKMGYENFDAAQNTTSKRPTISAEALNGKDLMRFDDTNLATIENFDTSSGLEVFVVVANVKSSSQWEGFVGQFGTDNAKKEWYLGKQNEDKYSYFYRTSSTTGASVTSSDTSRPNAILSASHGASSFTYYDSGTEIASANAALYDDGTEVLTIGASRSNVYTTNADIAEVLVFDTTLTDQQRIDINYDLSVKWGLTALTDSDGDTVTDNVDATPTTNNTPPILPAINPVTTSEDVSTTITFNITNIESDTLDIIFESNNPSLLPTTSITATHNNQFLTVTMDPVQDISGNVSITISISDAEYSDTTTFSVTFEPVNDLSIITEIKTVITSINVPISTTFNVYDIDGMDITMNFESGDTTLLQNSGFEATRNGEIVTVTFNIEPNDYGRIEVTINAIEGGITTSAQIIVTIDGTYIINNLNSTINATNMMIPTYNVDIIKFNGTWTIVKDGHEPVLGEVYDSLDWLTLSAQFDDINLPTLNTGLAWDLSTFYTDGILTVTQSPAAISVDPLIWLEAQDIGTLSTNNGQVKTWVNKMGSGHNFYQSTTGDQPTLNNTSLRFNGDSLEALENLSLLNDIEVILVLTNVNADSKNARFIGQDGSGDDDKGWALGKNTSDEYVVYYNTSDSSPATASMTDITDGVFHMRIADRGDGQQLTARLNGTTHASIIDTNGFYDGGASLNIGFNSTYADIAEVLVYDSALVTQNRSELNYHLAQKWGLSAVMDSDEDTVTDDEDTTPTASNVPPILGTISNVITTEDIETMITFNITNVESDSLTFSFESSDTTLLPTANISSADLTTIGRVTFNFGNNLSGELTVTISVSDGEYSDSQAITITVNAYNDPPTLNTVPNVITTEDVEVVITFSAVDTETSSADLTVSFQSSDTDILPLANISSSNTGGIFTVTFNPYENAFGELVVTVTVTDGDRTDSQAIQVTVNAVNDIPTISGITDFEIATYNYVATHTITVSDIETTANSLILTTESSDLTLIPTENITITGTGTSRTVTISAANRQYGTANVTINVFDATVTSSISFTVTVTEGDYDGDGLMDGTDNAPLNSSDTTHIGTHNMTNPTITLNTTVGATATFNISGTLNVTKLVEPSEGDSFNLINFGTLVGKFSDIQLPTLNTGLAWDLSDLYVSGSISVIATPGDASNLQLWLTVSDTGTVVTTNGTEITRVIDKSGNNNHAYVTATDNPTYVPNAQNSLAAILFDNADDGDELVINSTLGISGTNARSIFILTKAVDNSSGTIFSWRSETSGERYRLTPEIGLNFSDSSMIFDSASALSTSEYELIDIQHGDATDASDITLYLDGTSYTDDETDTFNTNGDDIVLGRKSPGVLEYDGYIAEVLVFDKDVTADERIEINYYLSQKWGLTASIDSDGDGFLDSVDLTPTTNNQAPEFLDVPNVITSEDVQAVITFNVENTGDGDVLTISFESSDDSLLPTTNITHSNDGNDLFTVTLNPVADQHGYLTITINANDTEFNTTTVLQVTINAVNDLSVFSSTSNVQMSSADIKTTTFNVSDVDSNDITITYLPTENISVTLNSGVITVTINGSIYDVGDHTLTINAIEGGVTTSEEILFTIYGYSATDNMNVVITAENTITSLNSGSILIDGTLTVTLSGYEPTQGEVYDILTWTELLTGQFDDIILPTLNEGLAWDLSNLYVTGSIEVIETTFGTAEDPVLWLDASDVGSISSPNGTIQAWFNKMGYTDFNVYQSAASLQPIISPNAMNGRSTIEINNHVLYALGNISTALGYEVFIVMNNVKQTDEWVGFVGQYGTSSSLREWYLGITPSELYLFALKDEPSGATAAWLADSDSEREPAVLNGTFDSDTGGATATFRVNGTTADTDTEDNGYQSDTGAILTVGATNTSNTVTEAEIAEIIIFDSDISEYDRNRVNYYLASKWGLSSVMDSDEDGVVDSLDGTPTGNNTAPAFNDVPEVIITEDMEAVITFSVTNTEGDTLHLSFDSSDTTILPLSGISSENNSDVYTVTFNPSADQFGEIVVTMTLTDGDVSSILAITVTINNVNDLSVISATQDVITSLNAAVTTTFNVTDADSDAISINIESSNTTLISDITATISGNVATVTFNPQTNVYGSSTITITVTEAGVTASETILFTSDGKFDATNHTATITAADTISTINATELITSGSLTVTLNGYVPVTGDSFDLFEWTSRIGQFTDIFLPTLNEGLAWNLSSLYHDGTIEVTELPTGLSVSPILWLDAADTGSISTANGAVSAWINKMGITSYNVYQSDTNYQPLPSENALNNRRTIQFSDDSLQALANVDISNGLEAFVVVTNAKSSASWEGYVGQFGNTNETKGWYLGKDSLDKYSNYYRTTSSAGGSLSTDEGLSSVVLNSSILSNGASQTLTLHANGNTIDSVTDSDGFYDGGTLLHVGAFKPNHHITDAEIAEVLVFDEGLTTQNRINITYYLSEKWGLTTLTDSDEDTVTDNIDPTPTSNNTPPAFTVTDNVIATEDMSATITFNVTNTESDTLTISFETSSANMLSTSNIESSVLNDMFTVTFNPELNATGDVTVTLSVSDGQTSAEQTFILSITPINDSPVLDPIADIAVSEDATITFNVSYSDVDNGYYELSSPFSYSGVTINTSTSSPDTVYGHVFNLLRTLYVDENAFGTINVTMNISDGEYTVSQSFTITIESVNDLPEVSTINSIAVTENTTVTFDFTISDVETPTDDLTITIETTNDTLFPEGNILISTLNGLVSVTMNPTSNTFGEALVTVSVSDGEDATISTFSYTVYEQDLDGDGVVDSQDAYPSNAARITPNITFLTPTHNYYFSSSTTTVNVEVSTNIYEAFDGSWKLSQLVYGTTTIIAENTVDISETSFEFDVEAGTIYQVQVMLITSTGSMEVDTVTDSITFAVERSAVAEVETITLDEIREVTDSLVDSDGILDIDGEIELPENESEPPSVIFDDIQVGTKENAAPTELRVYGTSSQVLADSLTVGVDAEITLGGYMRIDGETEINGDLTVISEGLFRSGSIIITEEGTLSGRSDDRGNAWISADTITPESGSWRLEYITISPGNSPGTVTINGDLIMTEVSSLNMEIAGPTTPSMDRIIITGNFTPAGTLLVQLIDGFVPTIGDEYDLLDWASITATASFDAITLPTMDATMQWDTSELYTEGKLIVAHTDYDGDGVDNGSDAFPYDPYLTAVPTTNEYLPVTDNLVLWLDAQHPHGDLDVTLDAKLQTWVDLSGNGNHAEQPTESLRASINVTELLNNEQALYSNTGWYYTLPTGSVLTDLASYNIFIVFVSMELSDTRHLLNFGNGELSLGTDGTSLSLANSALTPSSIEPETLTHEELYIINARHESDTLDMAINAQDITANITTSGTTALSNADRYILGNGASNTFTGFVGEIIIYNNTLTTTERNRINTYLGSKWSVYTSNVNIFFGTE